MRTFAFLVSAIVMVAGCKPKPSPPDVAMPGAPPAITDRDWSLVSLGENRSPLGMGGKPVTLRLESAESRVVGFAGCNRYSGPYTMSGEMLSFGPAMSTKMACEQGTEVEVAYLGMLPRVTGFRATDSSLTLLGTGAALAEFR